MPGSLTETILKVIVDAAGVRTGVDSAVRDLDRLTTAAERASAAVNLGTRSSAPSSPPSAPARDFARQFARSSVADRALGTSAADILRREQRLADTIRRASAAPVRQVDPPRRDPFAAARRFDGTRVGFAQDRRSDLLGRAFDTRTIGPSVGGAISSAGRFAGGAASTAGLLGSSAVGLLAGPLAGAVAGVAAVGFGRVVETVADVGGSIIGRSLSILASAAGEAIRQGSFREDASINFATLAGSQFRGEKVIAEAERFALDSPFKTRELLDQSKLLLSYGVKVDDLSKRLRNLGDVAAGTGVDFRRLSLAFGQATAKGRLQGGELRQFTEAGVGIRDFADAYREISGKRVSDAGFLRVVEQGEVSAKVVERAFERMTGAGGRFFGLAEARSKTLSGRFENLGETVELAFGKVGEAFIRNTSLTDFVDGIAKKIRTFTDDLKPVEAFFRNVDATVGPAITRVIKGFGGVFDGAAPGGLDFAAIDQGLKAFTRETIPAVLNAGRDLTVMFLDMAATIAKVIDLVDPLLPRKAGIDFVLNQIPERADFLGLVGKFGPLDPNRGPPAEPRPIAKFAAAAEARADALRKLDPGGDFLKRARGPLDFLDDVIGNKANLALQAAGKAVAGVFKGADFDRAGAEAKRINRFNRDLFDNGDIPGRLKPVFPNDVLAAEKAFAQLGDAVKARVGPLEDAFKRISDGILPDFGERLKGFNARLAKPEDKPFTDFERDIRAINFADGPLARSLGIGLDRADADRLRAERGRELIARFPGAEIKPAPLVRAGTQEAEAAFTRAVYASMNDGKTATEQLTEATQQAAAAELDSARAARELAAVLRGEGGDKPRDFFADRPGVGFPP